MMCLYYDFLPRNGPPFNDTFIFYSPEMPLPSLLPLVPLLSLLTTGQGQQTPASPPPMSSHSDSCNMIYSSISKCWSVVIGAISHFIYLRDITGNLGEFVYPHFITFSSYHRARQLQVQHLWPMKEAVGSNELRTRDLQVTSALSHHYSPEAPIIGKTISWSSLSLIYPIPSNLIK